MPPINRRLFLTKIALLPAAILAACRTDSTANTSIRPIPPFEPTVTPRPDAVFLPPTPMCGDDDDDDITLANPAGPFYTPNTPERRSLREVGTTATLLTVAGYVLSTDCAPIPNALVDFWHADENGVYDNVGYQYRGHQFTDADGRYTLETILPGLYTGRTRHIHVRVQPPCGNILTTQLYFPNEPANARDGLYLPGLELSAYQDWRGEKVGAFNFVVGV